MSQKQKQTVTASMMPTDAPKGNQRAKAVAEKIATLLASSKEKKGLDLLEALADLLETIPDDGRFEMNDWGERSKDAHECGFRGCAIGWGVHTGLLGKGVGREVKVPSRFVLWGDYTPDQRFVDVFSTRSLAKTFGISQGDVETLFEDGRQSHPDSSPRGVARDIRKVVARYRKAAA